MCLWYTYRHIFKEHESFTVQSQTGTGTQLHGLGSTMQDAECKHFAGSATNTLPTALIKMISYCSRRVVAIWVSENLPRNSHRSGSESLKEKKRKKKPCT